MTDETVDQDYDFRFIRRSEEILRFEPNGDIFLKGKLLTNEMDVVTGLKEFLTKANAYCVKAQCQKDMCECVAKQLATQKEVINRLVDSLETVDQYFQRLEHSDNWLGDEDHNTWKVSFDALAFAKEKLG